MKIVASYSIKGGVGKTALSVNLAYALAAAGHKTLLVDLDPQGAAAFYFRVKPAKSTGLRKGRMAGKRLRGNIRESDYANLDILPSNLAYRNFDIMLHRMKRSHSRLRKLLYKVGSDYDFVVLDCPPNITLLSENVFHAADMILVPVVPTTLSQRTFEQLRRFFKKESLPLERLVPFFSMVQARNRMHWEHVDDMRRRFPSFLETQIPLSVDVEKMGLYRMPVLAYARQKSAVQAYHRLCEEILERLS